MTRLGCIRAKDLRSFWANAHHDRPAGVRAASPTAWIPRSSRSG
ncbi:MAG: glycoside hydrolase TIM-barrel-like domain-containing protein [Caulobacteraceae bacterium]|nr:glycoside hydrolase TIM-barrel-like domain-containing protein [Caulobacteraceae bacterium]